MTVTVKRLMLYLFVELFIYRNESSICSVLTKYWKHDGNFVVKYSIWLQNNNWTIKFDTKLKTKEIRIVSCIYQT